MVRSVLAMLVGFLSGCGSGGTSKPDYVYPTEVIEEKFVLPEVPSHVFELVVWDTGMVHWKDEAEVSAMPTDAEVMEGDEVDWEEEEEVRKVEEAAEDVCVPNCENRECGSDGCGGMCGYCGWDMQCVEHEDGSSTCEEVCIPQCENKECGPDGCYGTCPPGCPENFVCNEENGLCYPFCDREENCKGKECGPDGCGGVCGTCGLGQICDEAAGKCVPDPCGNVPKDKGMCKDNNTLLECIDGQLVETLCSSLGPDYYCKFDGVTQKYGCFQGCVPQCTWEDGTPKECGYDGCFGECGKCTDGWICDAGKCYPQAGKDCGWITESGTCFGDEYWFCDNKTLYMTDCAKLGKKCGFDKEVKKYKCL